MADEGTKVIGRVLFTTLYTGMVGVVGVVGSGTKVVGGCGVIAW